MRNATHSLIKHATAASWQLDAVIAAARIIRANAWETYRASPDEHAP
ncbi:hypothetical protein DVDV_0403 [Desulfovibrio sp. DV]|nr:hypothetical protein [Desulfovibrio sp. DV]OLN30701.1 hypothetical protein DVDV_0403 [Desulfovibrio sp. DV]